MGMNERILELLKQVEEETNEEYQDETRRKRRLYNEILLPKFAELIVKECLAVINQSNGVGDDDVIKISRDVKKHFGVEEQVNDSKELHTCPYRKELHNDYETLCDCDEEQQRQCAMDI